MPKLEVKDSTNKATITLDGDKADLVAGGNGQDASLSLRDKSGVAKGSIGVFSLGGSITLGGADGKQRFFLGGAQATLNIGGNGSGGNIALFAADAALGVLGQAPSPPTVRLTSDGQLSLRTVSGAQRVLIDGPGGNIWLGGKGEPGDLMLFGKNEQDNLDHTKASVWVSGHNGDIILGNADCAEDFDIAGSEEILPGTVMVIDDEGKLRPSQEPYDKRVAGVVAGAAECRPGIILGRKHTSERRLPLAMLGKVYCQADARYSAIGVGDLLTTSLTAGHAMKAADPLKAFGAVIGKSLRRLDAGQGLIPILVALQ